MTGMGKPSGDQQTWVYRTSTDIWQSGSTGGGGGSSDWISGSGQIKTTSSVAISGQENVYASAKGNDVYYYVSGSRDVTGSADPERRVAVFGGDIVLSGAILPSKWFTVYDVRWDLQPTGSYGANGDRTINGAVWSVTNYVNAKSIGIIPGTGLVVGCNANSSEYGFGGNRNAPLLSTQVKNLFPQFSLASHRFRVWALLNPDNLSANFEAAFLAVENSGGLGVQQTYTEKRAFVTTSPRYATQIQFSGSNIANGPSQASDQTHNVLMIQWGSERQVSFWSGRSVDGINWPTDANLRLRTSYTADFNTNFGATVGSGLGNVQQSIWEPALTGSGDIGVVIGAATNNTNGTFTGSFRRFKLEVSPG